MRSAHDVETVRAAERVLMRRLSAGALMRRAAAGLAAVCVDVLGRVYRRRVVLLVGSGDNGGDALFAGARLAGRGARVEAVLLASGRAHPGGLAALRRAGGRVAGPGEVETVLDTAELVVDGVVGIGGRGGLRPEAARLAARVADSDAWVVAVDVPSGVDASTGAVPGEAVRADVTVTFGTYKPGLLIDPGAGYAGVVELVDIGLGPELPPPTVQAPQTHDVAAALPWPGREADKYAHGVVGVVAGSDAYPGAAVLCVGGALRGPAGYVRMCGTPRVAEAVLARWPEAVVSTARPAAAGRVRAWAVGPGMGTGPTAAETLAEVLAGDEPVVVDADGLTLLAEAPELVTGRDAPTLLTPHAGEAARLLGVARGEVEARRLEHARALADRYRAVVLLKGSTTLVAWSGAATRVNPTGTAALGTAGTGDVLTGLLGSLLAAGLEAPEAGTAGAFLHGVAGRVASRDAPISAQSVIEALPQAWREVTRSRG